MDNMIWDAPQVPGSSRNEKTNGEGSGVFFSNLNSLGQNQEANLDLVMDPTFLGADSDMFLCDREISWFLGEPNNDKGIFENHQHKEQNPISDKQASSSNTENSFQSCPNIEEGPAEAGLDPTVAMVKNMIYYAAVFRPVNIGMERMEKKKRKNQKISKDPQTVAARIRREKIDEKIRVLKRLVPGGAKMDTATMLDEAANYLKFLRAEIKALESLKP